MKRKNNLFEKIYNLDNLILADQKARKNKTNQHGIKIHDRNRDQNLISLQDILRNKSYRTSPYTRFTIQDPKEREISRLPYFPDRIVHHAIMNVIKRMFIANFTVDTYSCIEGRGIHAAVKKMKLNLKDIPGTRFCLKIDIRKFYPSVDHEVLKNQLRRKIKDKDLLWLLDEIIDSAPGVPIGNYLSQYLANFYMSSFDHWIKEVKCEQYYFRYADDIVLFSDNKPHLHKLLSDIRNYLETELKLKIKGNYQVFPVVARGIDFLGYVFYHDRVMLRKRIKQRFARMLAKRRKRASIAAYYGWAIHCNSKHLMKKLLHETVQRVPD